MRREAMKYWAMPDLWPHQKEELQRHTMRRDWGLFWSMRTGKTRAIWDCFGALRDNQQVTGVVVFCSKSAIVDRVWADQAEEYMTFPPEIVNWVTEEARRKGNVWNSILATTRRDVGTALIMARETLPRSEPAQRALESFIAANPHFMAVSDEHHRLRGGGSTFKAVQRVFKRASWRRVLTGTPTTNKPSGLWVQLNAMHKRPFGCSSKRSFVKRYVKSRTVYVSRDKTKEVEAGFINPKGILDALHEYGSVIKRENCPWLPKLQMEVVPVPMHPALMDRMEEVRKAKAYGARRYVVARQVCNGFNNPHELWGEWEHPRKVPKTLRLLELLEETDERILVLCAFRREMNRVVDAIEKSGEPVSRLFGEMNARQREADLRDYRDGVRRIMVATYHTVQDSIDLSVTGTIIWHSPPDDSAILQQANDRASLAGKKSVNVINLVSEDSVEKGIMEAMAKRVQVADLLRTPARLDDLLNGKVV